MSKKYLQVLIVGASLFSAASAFAGSKGPAPYCPSPVRSVPEISGSGISEIACLVIGGIILMTPRRARATT